MTMKLEIDVNVKGLEPIEKLISAFMVSTPNSVPQTVAEPIKQQAPVESAPNNAPVQEPVQPVQPVQPTAPVAEVAYSLEQLQKAAAELVQSQKIQSTNLFPILNALGCNALSDLPKDKFNDFALKIKELGGVI